MRCWITLSGTFWGDCNSDGSCMCTLLYEVLCYLCYNAHDGSQAKRALKWSEHYNEIGLPLVGYSANCTGRSRDIQNNLLFSFCFMCLWALLPEIKLWWFGLLLQLFSTLEVIIWHLGWLSHWTMGWACHLDGWAEKWGMMRHFVAADSPAAAVRGRAGRGLIIDRWDAKHRPAAS